VGSPHSFFWELRQLGHETVVAAVRGIALRVTAEHGYELTDVEVKRDKGGHLVRLFVDKEGGIGLDELQAVSEEVAVILDAEDPIPSGYTLEVSSPGLDRPLHGEKDYTRSIGKLVKLSSYEPVDGRRHWTGRLTALEDGVASVTLEKEGGKTCRVRLAKLSHGRLEVEFPKH